MRLPSASRFSHAGALLGLGSALGGLVPTATAVAHHPGSHALREPDGRVRLDAVVMASDACTAIAGMTRGTPPATKPPAGAEPVTIELSRPRDALCATVITALSRRAVLAIPREAERLHLYVLDPQGRVQTSERVPIR
jgi:hypothetical protein